MARSGNDFIMKSVNTRRVAVSSTDWLDGLALINTLRFPGNINRRRILQVASSSRTVLHQKLQALGETADRRWIKRSIADANPTRVAPARDVIAAALKHLLIAELGIMQAHKLENLPQAMGVFSEIADKIGFKLIERRYHLTRKK